MIVATNIKAKVLNMSNSVYDPRILHDLLIYNCDSGEFFWKPRALHYFDARHQLSQSAKFNAKYAGKKTFITEGHGGYLTTTVLKRRIMAHRAAWCMFHNSGIDADMIIDHIDGDTKNNRISNLRCCSASQNMMNAKKKAEGLRGAFFHKSTKKYQSSIRLHLGTYDTEEEASQAYEHMARIIQNEYYLPNGKRPSVSRAR